MFLLKSFYSKSVNTENKTTHMKVILTNFKCYASRQFEIAENGLTLIHGPSGIGKSTVCAAINFALYGSGNKLVKHDKTSCSVEIVFSNGSVLKRSKRPNYLTYQLSAGDETKYTDDAAQEIINRDFGSAFDVTGYLEQGSSNSFLLMSPANKSEFLERFAFRDINLSGLKEKSKALIKRNESDLLQLQGQLQLLRKLKDEVPVMNKVEFPLTQLDEDEAVAIAEEEMTFKLCSQHLQQISKSISVLEMQRREVVLLTSSKEEKEKEYEKLVTEIGFRKDEIAELSRQLKDDGEVDAMKTTLMMFNDFRKMEKLKEYISDLEKEIEKMKKVEEESFLKKKNDLSSKINLCSSKSFSYLSPSVTVTEQGIEYLQNMYLQIALIKQKLPQTDPLDVDVMNSDLAALEMQYSDIKKLVYKLESQLSILTCPSCDALLRHFDDNLVSVDDPDLVETDDLMADIFKNKRELETLAKSISQKQKEIHNTKMIISEVERVRALMSSFAKHLGVEPSDVENLWLPEKEKVFKEFIDNFKKLFASQNDLRKLGNFAVSDAILSSEKTLQKKTSEFNSLSLKVGQIQLTAEDEKLIQKEVFDQEALRKNIPPLQSKLESYFYRQRSDVRSNLEKISQSLNDLPPLEEINSKLSELLVEKSNLLCAEKHHSETLEKIKKYLDYKSFINRISSYSAQISALEQKELLLVSRLTASNKLKDLISDAEGQAITGLITSINAHARLYLDDFFPENPISVLLQPFKEVKKGASKTTKPQINVEIEYKEMTCGLDTLSGGEVARISLAYTLALAEMINTPILMLDECTSSLDADMSSIVIESIKSHMQNKTIIVIAHQAETGAYDNVITLV